MTAHGDGLLGKLERALTEEQRILLRAVRESAAEDGREAYLVGGSVRDLMLGERSPDLDVTLVGDAIAVARHVVATLGLGPPAVHEAFGTATVRAGSAWVDLITARREVYRRPGALPDVTPAGIDADLARRDFTINAMALGLSGPDTGRLLDPHGGRDDLAGGRVRILHPRSFQDDATRLLRATRYTARFGFALEPDTLRALKRSRRFLATISPARVRHEMLRMFQERRPVAALEAMQRMDMPSALAPGLDFRRRALPGWGRLARAEWSRLPIVWSIGALAVEDHAIDAYIERFSLTHAESRAVRASPDVIATVSRLAGQGPARASEAVAALERFPTDTIRAVSVAIEDGHAAAIASRYLEDWHGVRPGLSSERLKAMGVPEGPLFGAVLRRLRDARLDDPLLSLDAEMRLVQDMLNALPGA